MFGAISSLRFVVSCWCGCMMRVVSLLHQRTLTLPQLNKVATARAKRLFTIGEKREVSNRPLLGAVVFLSFCSDTVTLCL